MRDQTLSHSGIEIPENPFSEDVFDDHSESLPGVAQMHYQTFSKIVEDVESLAIHSHESRESAQLGKTILVTAPRAGYGKSHLTARLRQHLRSAATTLTLPLDPSRPVTWPVGLSSILRQFYQETGTRSGANSQFEEAGRFLLAQVVLSQLAGGNLNPKDCPADEARLRSEFVEIFSSESSPKMLAWIDKRASEISREASPDFLRQLGLSRNELGFWIRLIIDFNLRGDGALDPLRGLSNGEARERLLQWLRIATFYRPALIVADGLDGFFHSETAGMEIAEMLTGIRESVPRSITLVSINEDVWESVFENLLPSAWIDRITGETERLRPIDPESASEMIRQRLEKTSMNPVGIQRFLDRLETDHLWIDSETRLYPRGVIRQARDLWESDAAAFFKIEKTEQDTVEDIPEKPLSELTDKEAFFRALQEDRPAPAQPEIDRGPPTPQQAPSEGFIPPIPDNREVSSTAPTRPIPTANQNPFFQSAQPDAQQAEPGGTSAGSTPLPTPADQLADIDSIIADIRGTGNSVVSETQPISKETPIFPVPTDSPQPAVPIQSPAQPNPLENPAAAFQAGDLHVKPAAPAGNGTPIKKPATAAVSPATAPIQQVPTDVAPTDVAPPNIRTILRDEEQRLQLGPALQLDLERMEQFIRSMGALHPGLSQTEGRFPSSRLVCLRWHVRSQSILLGFESPQNVYFWNNLLQQSLASNRDEKIAVFSHDSDPFDPKLFASFGFNPAVTQSRIDIVRMNDRELAMIYAAESVYLRFVETPESNRAIQFITRHLDPLWRRISRPIA